MNPDASSILLLMGLSVTATTVHDLTANPNKKTPTWAIPAGGLVATFVLLGLSPSQPKLAKSFAILIFIATMVGPSGGALIDAVNKNLKIKQPWDTSAGGVRPADNVPYGPVAPTNTVNPNYNRNLK